MTVENLCFEPADGVEAAGREDLDATAPLPVEGVRPHRLALRGSSALLHQDGSQLLDIIKYGAKVLGQLCYSRSSYIASVTIVQRAGVPLIDLQNKQLMI